MNDTQEYKNYLITIEQDNDSENPREWDNVGTIIAFHINYNLGDKHNYNRDDFSSWYELEKQLKKDYKGGIILPIFMLGQSGITISTVSFKDQWDSGQIGFIVCSKDQIASEWSGDRNKAFNHLIDEVKTYSQYLEGDVYSYKIEKVKTCPCCEQENNQLIDSLHGLYGYNYAVIEAMSYINNIKE